MARRFSTPTVTAPNGSAGSSEPRIEIVRAPDPEAQRLLALVEALGRATAQTRWRNAQADRREASGNETDTDTDKERDPHG